MWTRQRLFIWLTAALGLAIAPVYFSSLRTQVDAAKSDQGTPVTGRDQTHARPLANLRPPSTSGPLRVSASNPRYFADRNGKVVYLVGSHTWTNLQDGGGAYPPPSFDYEAYLDFLHANNHNFFRLWMWEQPRWALETSDDNYWVDPLPYLRTGPGTATDGQPKFDLTKFNQAYSIECVCGSSRRRSGACMFPSCCSTDGA